MSVIGGTSERPMRESRRLMLAIWAATVPGFVTVTVIICVGEPTRTSPKSNCCGITVIIVSAIAHLRLIVALGFAYASLVTAIELSFDALAVAD